MKTSDYKDLDIQELLQVCADEPIHKIGEVQAYGEVLVLDRKGIVVAQSENLGKEFLGVNAEEIFPEEVFELQNAFQEIGKFNKNINVRLTFNGKQKNFYLNSAGDYLLLESEKDYKSNKQEQERQKLAFLDSLELMFVEHKSREGITRLAQKLSKSLSNVTGYDRVMVYKFHPDKHGEVIAETKSDQLKDSFLNLHYPESDIPSQARELYLKNLIRIISDVDGPRIKIISKVTDPLEIDLSYSLSRHVSPVHVEYLRNMGVRASMSISIVVDGKLWGLIACHHYSPKFVPFHDRALLKIVSHSFCRSDQPDADTRDPVASDENAKHFELCK